MRYNTIKLAVIATLGFASMQVNALAPFVDLPAAGTATAATAPTLPAVTQPLGTTAFKIFWQSENFGSAADIAYVQNNGDTNLGDTAGPTGGNASLPPAPYNTAGWGGAGNTASVTGSIVINNVYTGGAKTVGTYTSRVWRNAALGQCVYGFQATLSGAASADYLPAAGAQYFEINEIALGGFAGRAADAGYWIPTAIANTTASKVYRAGLSYTSVQHRAAPLWNGTFGYVALPLTTPAFAGAINGNDVLPTPASNPTPALQSASINDNWVNFTVDANANDDDGSTNPVTPWVYAHSTCAAGAFVQSSNAVRLRQTFQENAAGGQPNRFIQVSLPGYTPANNGAATTPAAGNPF